jgi:hypothetical protein
MVRCTAKAANMLGVRPIVDTAAGHDDWYINLVWIERRKNLLLLHAGTAFPIFIADVRKPEITPLGPWLCRQIANSLATKLYRQRRSGCSTLR